LKLLHRWTTHSSTEHFNLCNSVIEQAKIDAQGLKIRELKTAKAAKEAIQPEVDKLLALKAEYKTLTGKDFGAPANPPKEEPAKAPGPKKMAPNPENAAKKEAKKAERKAKGAEGGAAAGGDAAPAPAAAAAAPTQKAAPAAAAAAPAVKGPAGGEGIVFFASPSSPEANLKCWLVAAAAGLKMTNGTAEQGKHHFIL
jgi:WHEP-TRS domain